ncbi:hypothetical protein [Bdellovibrio sp. KM01]|uniref:hypothetical protein n=1 Tax=Bdellovibrio sp. KM01 TaxID=2748865 RepID=UPI0015E9E62D|nr:hypothetical protein [Bdellovibrio sp. KM01]QLY25674.1 hypothetical protein HW988_01075 [Bdellovibrio sp. KM01]
MLHLLVSLALAASPTESPSPAASPTPEATTAITLSPQKKDLTAPQTSKSLIEIAGKLNSMLPEQDKIIIPSQGSRQFFSQLAVMKKSSSNAQTAKSFLKLSDLSIQGCNAYSASGLTVANWNDANEVFKITNKQVRNSGNMKDAQALARVSLMVAQCKGPILLNMMGTNWLEQSLETLKAMNHRKLKKDDKMRLKALQEQVLTFDTKEALQNSLRYEVLISSAEVMKTLSEAPPAHAESPEDVFNNLLLLDKDGNPRQVSLEKSAEITMKLLTAVNSAKTYQFPEYVVEIDKQIKEGRDGIIEDLQLKDHGFTSYEKFQDEAFMENFSKKLTQDPDLLKRVKKNIDEHPEINTHLFQHSLAIYKVNPEVFEKFHKAVIEAQKEAKNLVK